MPINAGRFPSFRCMKGNIFENEDLKAQGTRTLLQLFLAEWWPVSPLWPLQFFSSPSPLSGIPVCIRVPPIPAGETAGTLIFWRGVGGSSNSSLQCVLSGPCQRCTEEIRCTQASKDWSGMWVSPYQCSDCLTGLWMQYSSRMQCTCTIWVQAHLICGLGALINNTRSAHGHLIHRLKFTWTQQPTRCAIKQRCFICKPS